MREENKDSKIFILIIIFLIIIDFFISGFITQGASMPKGGCSSEGLCVDYFGFSGLDYFIYYTNYLFDLLIIEMLVLIPMFFIYWHLNYNKGNSWKGIFKTTTLRLMILLLLFSLFFFCVRNILVGMIA